MTKLSGMMPAFPKWLFLWQRQRFYGLEMEIPVIPYGVDKVPL